MSTQNILVGALAAQLALAAVTWWPSESAPSAAESLIPGGANSITALAVTPSGDDAETVTMSATDGIWSITSEERYPADPEKLGEVLDALAGVTLRAPIATMASSHDKLKVSASNFGKKVELTTEGEALTVYLGAATSKSVYLRREGDDEVYQAKGLSEWAVKDNARSYWPNDVVSLDATTLTQLSLTTATGAVSFARVDDAWSLIDGPEGLTANTTAVDDLVSKLSTVRLSAPAGRQMSPSFGLNPGVHIGWTTEIEGIVQQGGLTLGSEVDSNYYATLDDSEFVVKVPGFQVKDLASLSIDALLTAPADPVPVDAPL